MIDRLEAEGGYNEDFMNEFRIFRKELRGFFSASTFTDILEAIKPSLDNVALKVKSLGSPRPWCVEGVYLGPRTSINLANLKF